MQQEAERNSVYRKKYEKRGSFVKRSKNSISEDRDFITLNDRSLICEGHPTFRSEPIARVTSFRSTKRGYDVKEPKSKCIEERLYQLLTQVTPTARKRLLVGSFSQKQRLALERWILTQKNHITKCDLFHTNGSCIRKTLCRGKHPTRVTKHSLQRRRSRTGVYGIQCHLRGKPLYRAKVTAGPFHLVTNYFNDLSEACQHLPSLLRIRNSVQHVSVKGCHRAALERSFREALAVELPRHTSRKYEAACGSGKRAEWHVKFFMTVAAKRWVGRSLHTPLFDVSGPGLDAGLQAWHRLCAARSPCDLGSSRQVGDRRNPNFDLCEFQSCWTRVRQSLLLAWTEAGRLQHAERHLRKLTCSLPQKGTHQSRANPIGGSNASDVTKESESSQLSSVGSFGVSVVVPVARGTSTAFPSRSLSKTLVTPRATRGTFKNDPSDHIEQSIESLLETWSAK